MTLQKIPPNQRILIIDDSSNVHADFRDILAPEQLTTDRVEGLEAILFGDSGALATRENFELEFALQGEEGVAMTREALRRNAPFAVAFVDMRMPPGIDGLETIEKIWELDSNIQIVIATAYSDRSRGEIVAKLGRTDQLLILRKPFEPVEIRQAAAALSEKWRLAEETRQQLFHLESTVEALAFSNRELRRLGYISAHHLQEPLRTLQISCDLLYQECNESLSANASKFLDSVREEAERARFLIADLLVYARVDMSSVPRERVDLNDVVDQALRELREALVSSDSSVKTASMPTIFGDAGQWQQVFHALIENAIVYRCPGGANIEISAEPTTTEVGEDQEVSGWEIALRDDGIGVDPKHRESVFALFERLDDRETHKGTGVGLAICRRIVERHGGRIWIDASADQSEQGTVVRFVIPDNPLRDRQN